MKVNLAEIDLSACMQFLVLDSLVGRLERSDIAVDEGFAQTLLALIRVCLANDAPVALPDVEDVLAAAVEFDLTRADSRVRAHVLLGIVA